jgi:hypothetical protein
MTGGVVAALVGGFAFLVGAVFCRSRAGSVALACCALTLMLLVALMADTP